MATAFFGAIGTLAALLAAFSGDVIAFALIGAIVAMLSLGATVYGGGFTSAPGGTPLSPTRSYGTNTTLSASDSGGLIFISANVQISLPPTSGNTGKIFYLAFDQAFSLMAPPGTSDIIRNMQSGNTSSTGTIGGYAAPAARGFLTCICVKSGEWWIYGPTNPTMV